MTTVSSTPAPPRSGPAIRALLEQWSPTELQRFDAEFHQAIAVAGETFDIAPLNDLLERWRRIAALRANPLTPEEHQLLHRVRAGDDRGLWEQAEDGTFHRLG